jgi:capsid portal protein
LQVRKGLREVAIYNVNAKNLYIKPEYDINKRPIAGSAKEYVHVCKTFMPISNKSLYTYKPFTGKPKNGETSIYHFRGHSINSDFYGEPTYLSVDSAIEESGYVSEFNINFFSNNAQPNYVIGVTGVKMSRAREEELKKEMTDSLKGLDNAHRGLVLFFANEKAKIDVKELSHGYDESFSKLKKDIAEVISTAHLMPMELLPQSGTSNFGGGTATIGALKVFLEMVVKPRQEFYESNLNKLMTSLFGFDPKIKLKNIKITTEKDDAIVHVMYKKEGILTTEEIRADLKRKELGKIITNETPSDEDTTITEEGESRVQDINTDNNNRGTDAITDL